MSAMDQERRGDRKNNLFERLHNPTELRICLMLVVLGIGYAVIYLPFNVTIAATTRKLHDAQKKLALADEVDVLQRQYRTIKPRIPTNPDVSEWLQYVLGGLRQFPVKLDGFSPDTPKALGMYQILTIKVKVIGGYDDLDRLICWLESNPRLFRVDSVRMTAASKADGKGSAAKAEPGEITADIVIVGLMG
jgi:Tfp pilus assembly protein PilO